MKIVARDARRGARDLLGEIFERLERGYREETWHWAPDYVRGPMDIVAGAVLVQHTNWRNAARALEQLRDAGALDPARLASMPDVEVAPLIAVSGTPTVKARRLQAVAATIVDAGGIDALLALPPEELRARLLATHGLGPESADAIALYAAHRPVFVIDAYTRRMFRRLGIGPQGDGYDAWQRFFHDSLPADAASYQGYHAHIVLHSKAVCRARPRCGECLLADVCASAVTAV